MTKSLFALAFLLAITFFTVIACTGARGEAAEEMEPYCDFLFQPQEWGTLYRYKRDGLWGFKDAYGNVIVEPQYSGVRDFSEGLAFVMGVRGREDQTGFIDLEGNLVIPLPTVSSIHNSGWFSEGLAHVVIRPWGRSEDPLIISHYITGPYIFIDREGRDVFEQEFEYVRPFVDGLSIVTPYREHDMFIDRTGQNPFGMEFRSASNFDEDGFASVRLLDGTRTHLDRNGNIVNRRSAIARATSDEWDSLRLLGSAETLWGFLDTAGNIVIDLQYRHALSFTEGLAFVQGVEGREYQTGFIDHTGELVIPLPNALSAGRFFEGFALIINRPWDFENEEVANRRTPGPYIFIDRTGQNAINQEFADARHFIDGIARVVLLNGNVAFIDTTGENIFGEEFLCARDFIGNILNVTLLDGTEVRRIRPQ